MSENKSVSVQLTDLQVEFKLLERLTEQINDYGEVTGVRDELDAIRADIQSQSRSLWLRCYRLRFRAGKILKEGDRDE
ncbi:MAG: hypothetical protein AAFX78_10085 [Cyanobacteria bacterium J06638_20]